MATTFEILRDLGVRCPLYERSKRGYPSEASAVSAAQSMQKKYKQKFEQFYCHTCRRWHVGRP